MNPPERKRRPRYSGTHPRRFDEKYKELHPERYPELIEKLHGKGKTPAGTHRPICLSEVLEVLRPQPGKVALDATLGHGGHAIELWRAIQPGGKLFALDADPLELPRTEARLRAAGLPPESFIPRRMNFAGISKLLATEGLDGFDLVLADLGVSSMQLDNPARGFTF